VNFFLKTDPSRYVIRLDQMPNYREQIESLLAAMERDARESYARGWADAIAALQAKAPEMTAAMPAGNHPKGNGATPDTDSKEPQRARGRPERAISLVQSAIFSEPGLRGVDIVRTLEKNGTPVVDRTVRSALRRLREAKIIWERKKRWYPKPKERLDSESGEPVGSTPH
jgi:hypothetical protein